MQNQVNIGGNTIFLALDDVNVTFLHAKSENPVIAK